MSVTTLHCKKKKNTTHLPHMTRLPGRKKRMHGIAIIRKKKRRKKPPNNETSFLITVTTGKMKLELSHKWITYFPEIDKQNKFRQPAAFPTEIDSICGM